MARIILHTIYPFRAGTDRAISDAHFLTIELERAKRDAGATPFRIVEHLPNLEPFDLERHCLVTDACEALPARVAQMTERHSDA